jgi:hypothetical protein
LTQTALPFLMVATGFPASLCDLTASRTAFRKIAVSRFSSDRISLILSDFVTFMVFHIYRVYFAIIWVFDVLTNVTTSKKR